MIAFTLSLLLGASLYAQPLIDDIQLDSIRKKEMKEILVYSHGTSALSSTLAIPMVVVDKSALQNSSFSTPADALQRETGISLSRDGIWATSVNVRGFSEQRLLFLVDNDRIQTATDIAAALSTVDMSSLERIEVIKGAGSVLYGTGAMGGVVNFVTERPTYTPFFKSKGDIGSELNSVNSLWVNNANLQFTTSQWYLSLNGSYRKANNMQTPDGKLPNSQFNDASWGLKAGALYGDNQELLVNYQHVKGWDIGLPGGSAFPATAKVRYIGVERNQLSAEYVFSDLNINLREIRLKAYTQNISRDVENIVKPTLSIFPSSLNRTWGFKATTLWRFTDYHNLTLGVEGWERKSETLRLRLIQNADTIGFGEQPTPDAQMLDVGAFAHYSWKISPRKWTLNAGIRFDYIQTANDSAFNPVFQYSVKKGEKIFVENFSRSVLYESAVHDEFSYAAHLDLVYNPTRRQKLALSISNSYRAASIEERFKYIDQAGILRVGNPNLKPERGTFSNLSYLISANKLLLKADVYANYLFDLITEERGIYNFQNANGTNSSVDALVNVNVSKAFFVGAELEARWILNRHFWMLANASYTRARDIDANTFLAQIPPLKGLMTLNYQLEKQFEASFSALWAANQSEVAPGENTTDGYAIFNFDIHSAKINYTRSSLQLFAGVENILNTAYFNHLSTTRGLMRLEPGRNIYLKVKWGW